MDIIVHECSRCKKRHISSVNMRRHVKTRLCEGAQVLHRRGRISILDDQGNPISEETEDTALSTTTQTQIRAKPGPRAMDIAFLMKDRLPAYDEGDDERIDRVFEEPDILENLLNIRDVTAVAPYVFNKLWGKDAPDRFQSFGMYGGKVHEVSNDGTVVCRGRLTKSFVREIVCYILDFVKTVLTVSLPARCPDGDSRSARLEAIIRGNGDGSGATIRDILERTEAYRKARGSLVSLGRAIEDAFIAGCASNMWTPYAD